MGRCDRVATVRIDGAGDPMRRGIARSLLLMWLVGLGFLLEVFVLLVFWSTGGQDLVQPGGGFAEVPSILDHSAGPLAANPEPGGPGTGQVNIMAIDALYQTFTP